MVQLIKVTKVFGNQTAIDNITIGVKKGEFVTLLGRDGCGKSTVLRIIAGFEDMTTGRLIINDKDVSSMPSHERKVDIVFQSYALFPHMDVFENIAFGLKLKEISNKEIRETVMQSLSMVKLEGYHNSYPSQLNGEQKFRIALAKAIANNPEVILLDEPLDIFDLKIRKQKQDELKNIQRKLGITFIYATNNLEEALSVSDRIIVMNKGRIERVTVPEQYVKAQ